MSVVDILSELGGSAPVADLFFADSPAFLISGETGDVVFANPAAAAFVRADNLRDLICGNVRLRGPANARLSELAGLPDLSDSARIEMLRFFVGTRAVTLPFMCQRADAPAPQPNVFAIAAAPPASDLTLADKAAIAFDGDPHPVALFDVSGERVYANEAALAGRIDSAEQLDAAENLARYLMEDGELVLYAGEKGGSLTARSKPSIADLPNRNERGMAPIAGAARDVVRGLGAGDDLFTRSAEERELSGAGGEDVSEGGTAGTARTASVSVPGTRFRFTLDSEARLLLVEPALPELGLSGAVGDSLDDLLTGDLMPLVEAIEHRDTFNGVKVLWQAHDDGDPVEVEIAGLPLLDGRGGYEGLRGFSVIGTRKPAPPMAMPDDIIGETPEAAVDDAEVTEPAETPEVPRPSALKRIATGIAGIGAGGLFARHAGEQDAESEASERDEASSRLDDADQRAFAEIAERLNGTAKKAESPEAEDGAVVTEARQGPEAESDRIFEDDDAASSDAAPEKDDETPEAPAEDVTVPAAAYEGDNIIRAPIAAPAQTSRKLARGRAQDANDFITLIDRLPFGLMFVRDEKPLYANRAMLDLFGYADLDDLEIAGGLHSLFENLANTREPGKRMLAGVTREGLPIELDARLQLAPWIDGPALLLSARERLSSEDDDQINELEAEIVELKDILDTATDGIVLLDNDGDIISLNHSAEALFGMDSREARGASFAELFTEIDRDTVSAYLEGLHDNGVASVLNDGRQINGIEKGGGKIPLFLTIGRVGLGQRQKFCAVLRDITQWKRSEDELLAARNEAVETASQKSDVLTKVSHEVRTPLNAIIGFADVMLEEQFGPLGNERYRDYIKDIKASGEHIISLVNDLLDLSKVEAGMMDMDFGEVHLNDVVEQCVAIMQGQANRDRIILRTSLAPSLPHIVADVRSIRQILLNLLSNAVKFTPASGQVIVSTVYTDGGEVLLRVRDTGLGMSESDIEAALEPYRQTTRPTRPEKNEGTGIGLPLTKALAEANRAVFSIESKLDSGTLVQVTFPSTRVLAE
ncbi:MAG: PAS domain-containing sensor histidine kinase [Rhodobiaceae bacterium]|nr:PAS domain-containing sensor histidine kinase [Rhodobiaceae bacterium]MCC0052266.1 PAS domain-containing sensor histidine kinase [Rhodobiaceae bacterium]MCC0059747.1 PAS domain-containing sensor histidine kinase [Rhodobiaceae bacterium]